MTTITKNTPINITIWALIALVVLWWSVAAYASSITKPLQQGIYDNSTEIRLIKQQMTNDSDRLERIEEKLDKALWI